MFPNRLWTAFRFRIVPWEDTLRFHARLLRCFFLGLVDTQNDLALVSPRYYAPLQRTWIVLAQALVDGPAADPSLHAHAHRVPTWTRCPPKRPCEPTMWHTNTMAHAMHAVPPSFVPHLIHHHHHTHALSDQGTRSAVILDIRPASAPGLGGYDGPVDDAGMIGYLLLWLLAFTIVWCVAYTRSACRFPRVAVGPETIAGERENQSLSWNPLAIHEMTQGSMVDACEMPGAWFQERLEQKDMFEGPVLKMLLLALFRSYAGMGTMAQAYCSRSTLDHLGCGPNDAMMPERQLENVSNGFSLDSAALSGTRQASTIPTLEVAIIGQHPRDGCLSVFLTQSPLHRTERAGAAPDHIRSESSGSTIGQDNWGRDPSMMMGDVASMTALDVACEDQIGLARALVASRKFDQTLYLGNACDDDEHASEGGSDEESFGGGAWRADGTLLRRTAGYLWRRRGEQQVNARLSDERDSRQFRWPHENETDNWRLRSSHVTRATEETNSIGFDNHSTKLRCCSSLFLNITRLPDRVGSHATNSDNGTSGPQGAYVVPQKRSRRRPSDRPGFFPSRETPALLTPEARRPGGVYFADPGMRTRGWVTRGSASATGHTHANMTEGYSLDVPAGPVSWRDRYENDPASRRVLSSNRRVMTER